MTSPRSTLFLGPTLRSIKQHNTSASFSARVENIAARYLAITKELTPKLPLADWKAVLEIIKTTSFHQPGDAYLLPLRAKSAHLSSLTYRLEAMKLPELIAIIETGESFLAENPIDDQAIRDHLPLRD